MACLENLDELPGFDAALVIDAIMFTEVDVGMMVERYKPLFVKHWEEVAIYKDVRPLDPDWQAYVRLGRAGLIRCFAALDMDNDNEVRAYSVYALSHSLHYRTWYCATNDIYYVHPDERRTRERWLAYDFFRKAEEWLRGFGVRLIRYPTKVHLDNAAVFHALDYACVERVVEKLV